MAATDATAKVACVAASLPLISFSCVLMVLSGAGASASPEATVCGGGGTATTIAGVTVDAEQMANAHTIVAVTAHRPLPSYASVVAVATAYTESRLRNTATHTDHDSEGLFQQRVSIYTKRVADDPVRATDAFLDRLVQVPSWRTNAVGVDAQAVQHSSHPERYQPNGALAAQLVEEFWPVAAAAAAEPTTQLAVCAGGGGQGRVGQFVGPTGNNIAGTTRVPTGLVINGSARAARAVRYAFAQLGKPYVFGAAGPDAFDCSGLTMAAWAAAGILLPHLAAAQAHAGTPESTGLADVNAGDLVLIPGSDGTAAEPGHVGMIAGYVDRADGRHVYLVQAPEAGVPVELTEATEWSGQIVAVRHIA
jgi:cell wall-associated NlpC family hydrolase